MNGEELADRKRLVAARTRHPAGPEDPNETGGSFNVIDQSAGD
jgi:hypothetical protein